MYWSKSLLGCVCVILHSIVSVQGYGINADVKLEIQKINDDTIFNPNSHGDIIVSGEESLDLIIGHLLMKSNAMVKASATATPSTVMANDDKCVFGVAFLSSLDSDTEKPFPSRDECEMNGREPIIGDLDKMLAPPKCVKNSELETLDFSKFIGNHDSSPRCGRYRLVGMLDPLRELQEDPNICNNYVTFDLYFNCSSNTVPEPTCELDSGLSDGDDVRLIFRNHVKSYGMSGQPTRLRQAAQMFRQRETSTGWSKEFEKEVDAFGMYGKMVLKVVKAHIQGMTKESLDKQCSQYDHYDAAKDWVKRQLDEIQGLNSGENTMNDTKDASDNSYKELLRQFKTVVRSMNNESQLQNIQDGLRSYLQNYKNASEQNGVEAMRTTITGLLTIIHDRSKHEYAKKRVQQEVCEMANTMEEMKKHMAEVPQSYYQASFGGRFAMFMNATSTLAVKLMFFYPDFYDKCYENMLVHFHGAFKPNSHQANFTWMYEGDFQQRLRDYRMNKTGFTFQKETYDKLLQSCGKSNSCIRKMKSVCRQANSPASHIETVETLRDEVCKMKILKEAVSKHTQHLTMMQNGNKTMQHGNMTMQHGNKTMQHGNQHGNNTMQHGNKTMQNSTMQKMHKDAYDAVCNGNNKMEMKKQMLLTRIEDGVIKRGVLDLSNEMIAWQIVARCRCDYCGDRHDKDGGHSKPEWGDSSDYDNEETPESEQERPPPGSDGEPNGDDREPYGDHGEPYGDHGEPYGDHGEPYGDHDDSKYYNHGDGMEHDSDQGRPEYGDHGDAGSEGGDSQGPPYPDNDDNYYRKK